MSRVRYEYRCDGCGAVEVIDQETKNKYGASNGTTLYLGHERMDEDTGRWSPCTGMLRRVWGAHVSTATVPGFYNNATNGEAPTGAGASID